MVIIMDFIKAFAVHFVALLSLCAGALSLITAVFGEINYEWGGKSGIGWHAIYLSSGAGKRESSIISGILSLAFGSLLLLVAVEEFRPASYPLLLIGFWVGAALLMLVFKYATRSVEAAESVVTRSAIIIINVLLVSLFLIALVCLGQFVWRVWL